jgi:hypothetical protein
MSQYDEQPDLAPEEHASEHGAADESPAVADDAGADNAFATGDGSETTSTGVAVVDDVLASVQALDGRPVEEHVAVFEQAHERLRRALDPGHG